MSDGLLSDIRVVEVGSWLAAPLATMLLAEAGADVVKVEPPTGDPARTVVGFSTWNRSKRSAVLDLHTDDGRAALQGLLARADVLVHDLRPSVARRAGIDDDALAARYPALVSCSVLGWPHGHPDEDRPGYDILAQAATGVMDEELGTRPGPVFLRFPFPSYDAAFLAVVGVLARLRVRDQTGDGGPVWTSLMQGALAPMSKHWSRTERTTPGMAGPNLFKGLNMVQLCGDGLGVVSTMSDVPMDAMPLYQEVVAELAAAGYDPSTAPGGVLGQRTRAEWLEAMWAVGIPTAEVATELGQILSDPQALANDYALAVDDPEHGATVQAGHPFHVTPPLAVQRPTPRLGEHTDEVLAPDAWPARPLPGPRATARPARPLDGLKVLDFGMFLAGPYGPQLMADMGAEVVKVEAPTGDRLRMMERVFAGCQRGKRSVALDLRSPDTRPVLEKLVEWADVVHHNLRMPPARLLGLDPETVRAINPSVVYCHVSSYGPNGPRKDWPGIDPTSQAVVGWMQEGAGLGNPPRWYRIGVTDDQCAMSSVIAVMLALRHREATGEGADVRASILGAAVLTTSETMLLSDGSIAPYPRLDHDQTGIAPGYRIYECADGWIAVAAPDDATLGALRDVAGVASDDAIADAVRSRDVAGLVAACNAARVPVEPVQLDHERAFFDSDVNWDLGLAVSFEHAQYGRTDQVGPPLSFGGLEGLGVRTDRPVPVLGQHSAEV